MALTQEQLDVRRAANGATDIVALMNGRALDVFFAKKFGEVAQELADDDPRSLGSDLEPSLAVYAMRRLGTIRVGVRVAADDCPIIASLDAITAAGEPVEFKTSGLIFAPGYVEQWGPDGSDEIPDDYIIQTHAQMVATKARRAYVVALIGGRGFVLFVVHRNERLADFIREIARRFWDEHVVPGILPTPDVWPDLREPSLDVLKRVQRTPLKAISLTKAQSKLVDEWRALKDAQNVLKRVVEEREARALALLGDAEAATLPDGRLFTYLETVAEHAAKEAKTVRFRMAHVTKGRVSPDEYSFADVASDSSDPRLTGEPKRLGSDQIGGPEAPDA